MKIIRLEQLNKFHVHLTFVVKFLLILKKNTEN